VSEDLGVRYVLDGNIRTSGNRVRISVQLIDALEGYQLWTERYDEELSDIFAIYDEITQKVILAMEVILTKGEKARLIKRGTENIEAYLKVLQGTELFVKMNKIDNVAARKLFLEAINLDKNYPVPYAYTARTHLVDVWLRASKSPAECIRQGFQYAQKAITLDNTSEMAHLVLASCYLLRREHQKAIEAASMGLSINPNSADNHLMLGQVLVFADKPKAAIAHLELAIRLDPFARSQFFHLLGFAYREAGKYDKAIDACQEAIRRQRNNIFAHLILAATYIMNDQPEEARFEAAEVLRINPSFSLERLAKIRPHIDPENTKRFISALRKAGLE
jgi:adenylate cyclase